MNCLDVQQLLLECTGSDLTTPLSEHLAECEECTAYWEELSSIADMFSGEQFELSEVESGLLLKRVEEEIALRTNHRSKNQPFRIVYLIPIAATILLLLGISQMQPDDDTIMMLSDNTIAESEYYEPEESMVIELLAEFTSNSLTDPSASLLGDLTDDELAYLNDNFDVGDIL